jgi:probable rRNA maturation factor
MLRAMPVLVSHEGRFALRHELRATSARIARQAQRMLDALGMRAAQLSILLCDDATMRVLNREHRAIDRPTDVLAFAMGEGHALVSVTPVLGDVVISLPTVERQAAEHRCTIEQETRLLLAHGLLHLLGFDHATRAQERTMTARTHMLMAAALPPQKTVEKQGRPIGRRLRTRSSHAPRHRK